MGRSTSRRWTYSIRRIRETGSGGDGGTGGTGSSDPGLDFNNATNSADDTFDQSNANTETTRIAAVTGVRDTLDAGLAAADSEWGTTMDAAGSRLGSALDGIQDFDWQHVRDYVGAVTTARQTAEQGALTAQVGFVTSYYSSLNSYTASIASASVTHATAYAQSTADYYVNTVDHTADDAEADLATAISNGASASEVNALTATATAKRAKANAFATYSTSYVTFMTSEAQTASTTAVAGVTSANATALAEITAEVATATTDINTFYSQQVTAAQSPPPVNPDANGDGIPDPVAPTASLTANINAAKTANTTARTGTFTAFADLTTPRTTSTTSTTNTYTALSATTGSSTSGSGTTGGSNGNIPSAQQAPGGTPATPLQPTPPGSGNPASGPPPAFGGSGPVLAQQISETEELRDTLEANLSQPVGHGTDIGPDQVAAWEDQLAEVNNNLERLQQQQREEAELAAAIERVRRGEARVPDALSVPASTTSPQTDEIARAMQNAKDDYRRWGRPSDGEQYLHLHQLHRESLAEDVKWSNDDLYRDQPTYGTLSPGIDIETTVKPPNSPDLKNWTEAGGTYGVDPNGTWWFRNARGVLVRYSNGEPDFLGAGRVRAQYSGMTGDRNIDRRIANRQHPIPEGTELHHTSRNVGQAVDEEIHRQFRHRGGVAGLKRIPLRLPPPTRTPPPPRGGR